MDDLQFYVLFNSILANKDDGRMIMKGYVQWNPSPSRRFKPEAGFEPGIARSVGQIPGLLNRICFELLFDAV